MSFYGIMHGSFFTRHAKKSTRHAKLKVLPPTSRNDVELKSQLFASEYYAYERRVLIKKFVLKAHYPLNLRSVNVSR